MSRDRRGRHGYGFSVAASLAIAGVWGASCDRLFKKPPEPGGECSLAEFPNGLGTCVDDHTFVVCEDFVFKPISCGGKRGCFAKGNLPLDDSCDLSGNAAGEACVVSYWNQGQCAADGKSVNYCGPVTAPLPVQGQPFVFESWPCKGPDGCTTNGTTLHCDVTRADVGDRCSTIINAKSYTCSADSQQMLGCTGDPGAQNWLVARECRGPKGCTTDSGPNANCDSTIARVGDPCQDKQISCSEDGKAELRCADRKFVESQKCAGGCSAKWTAATEFRVTCETAAP